MARKVTEEDWKKIEAEIRDRGLRYKILDVEDGEVTVEFLDTVYETRQGEEDLLGRIWEKEWAKIEAKVLFDGLPCILSFGWYTSPFFRTFKAKCQEHNIIPDDLLGTKWKFYKKDASEYIIKYLGKNKTTEKTFDVSDNSYDEVVETIKSLKDEPELLADGIPECLGRLP